MPSPLCARCQRGPASLVSPSGQDVCPACYLAITGYFYSAPKLLSQITACPNGHPVAPQPTLASPNTHRIGWAYCRRCDPKPVGEIVAVQISLV